MGKPVSGRVTFRFDGQKYSTTGNCDIDPWNFEGEAESNTDGTVEQKVKPAIPMINNLDFRAVKGLTTETMKQHFNKVDVTFEDTDSGTIYYFNEAFIVGKPTFKSDGGIISGLNFTSNNIRVVTE